MDADCRNTLHSISPCIVGWPGSDADDTSGCVPSINLLVMRSEDALQGSLVGDGRVIVEYAGCKMRLWYWWLPTSFSRPQQRASM